MPCASLLRRGNVEARYMCHRETCNMVDDIECVIIERVGHDVQHVVRDRYIYTTRFEVSLDLEEVSPIKYSK